MRDGVNLTRRGVPAVALVMIIGSLIVGYVAAVWSQRVDADRLRVGIVVLGGTLAKLGVPPESIGLILSVDRFLDMCRTVVNVSGDLTASVVMDRILPPTKDMAKD